MALKESSLLITLFFKTKMLSISLIVRLRFSNLNMYISSWTKYLFKILKIGTFIPINGLSCLFLYLYSQLGLGSIGWSYISIKLNILAQSIHEFE